jgi:hypothetical protein
LNFVADAQQKITLKIKYNSEENNFGVYAKANFTRRNFLWGPSQITITLPASLPNEKLRIKNLDGGTWEDNSLIFAPEVNNTRDFHGLSSSGNKTDLVENNEILLFYFSISEKVVANEVRLFDNNKDPKSSDKGMNGGDFQNSITDDKGKELYQPDVIISSNVEKKEEPENKKESEIALTLFPNVTKEKFNIALEGVEDKTNVTLLVSTEKGIVIMQDNGTKKALVEKTFKIPSQISSQSLVVRVKINATVIGKRLILERE